MLTSRLYDGTVIETKEQFRKNRIAPENTAKLHRWKVRATLYAHGLNRLPEIENYREVDANA